MARAKLGVTKGGWVMRIGAHWRYGYVAAGLLAIGAGNAPGLAAQKAEKPSRVFAVAPPAPREVVNVQAARGVLGNLVGTWRFEIWFAGNFDAAPDATGMRVVKALFDDLRLEWTEHLDHSAMQGQGIVGFDPRSGRFFSASVYSGGAAPEFTTGVLDGAQPLITFTPISMSPGLPNQQLGTALNMLDRDHFSWVALDGGWRAVFTRQ
jgi:hypothetical protein